mmetsp:Transcript_10872/g.16036  ORF Transcript_10872/g.16036 Transcript_10872/m.16036 type:complete len:91 (+) Transcript_10872:51-323(+)
MVETIEGGGECGMIRENPPLPPNVKPLVLIFKTNGHSDSTTILGPVSVFGLAEVGGGGGEGDLGRCFLGIMEDKVGVVDGGDVEDGRRGI